jgi:hypothetical protein
MERSFVPLHGEIVMAKRRKGKRLTKTGSYEITAKKGKKRSFTGTLEGTMNIGKVRVAIFHVPKGTI